MIDITRDIRELRAAGSKYDLSLAGGSVASSNDSSKKDIQVQVEAMPVLEGENSSRIVDITRRSLTMEVNREFSEEWQKAVIHTITDYNIGKALDSYRFFHGNIGTNGPLFDITVENNDQFGSKIVELIYVIQSSNVKPDTLFSTWVYNDIFGPNGEPLTDAWREEGTIRIAYSDTGIIAICLNGTMYAHKKNSGNIRALGCSWAWNGPFKVEELFGRKAECNQKLIEVGDSYKKFDIKDPVTACEKLVDSHRQFMWLKQRVDYAIVRLAKNSIVSGKHPAIRNKMRMIEVMRYLHDEAKSSMNAEDNIFLDSLVKDWGNK